MDTSSMLKKVKSFKDKFRRGPFYNRNANSSGHSSPLTRTHSVSSRDDRKRRNIRAATEERDTGSTTTQRPMSLADEKHQLLAEPVHPNVQSLQARQKKVQQTIKYINFAIEKGNHVQLPGAATVALEETLKLITFITGLLSSEPRADLSYKLTCTYSSLAELIEWADQVILMDSKSELDVAKSKKVMQSIELTVNDLSEFTCDLVRHLKVPVAPGSTQSTMTLPSKARQKKAQSAEESEVWVKRNSMPEVPLTAREKTILRETSLGAFDNPLVADRGDSVSPTSPTQSLDDPNEEAPPPKPYLPPDFNLLQTLSSPSPTESPPDLPTKTRAQLHRAHAIGSSSTDSLDASYSNSCKASIDGAHVNRPRSALIAGHLTKMDNYEGVRPAYIVYGHSDRSAHSSGQLFSSHDSIDGPIGKRSSAASNSSMSSVGHGSQTKTLSDITERAHSHSIPLALSEDLSPIQPLHSNHMGCVAVDELSTRIEQLAQEFRPRSGEHTDTMTAPLKEILDQAKPRARLGSDYDNVSSTGSFDSPTTPPSNCMASSEAWVQRMGRSVMNRSFDGLTSVSQWQQQQMSGQTQWTLTNKGYEQQSKSVTVRTTTESLSMTTHQRIASNSSFQPPPLPPKRKHVESYMQVFGPGQELSEFHPVESVNSKQFYLHVQEQYQLELFHPQAAIMGNGNFMYQPQPVEMGLPPNVPVGFLMDSSLHSEMGDMDGECSSPIQHADELSAESIATSLEDEEGDYSELNPLDMIDVHDLLVRESCADTTSNSSDSAVGSSLSTINSSDSKQCKSTVSKTSSKILSGLKGGSVDALVVYATHVGKHDFMYQEAFLTTYRTFIEPEELIDKLLYRYNKFAHLKEINKKRLSRNAFSLLVRVVDELTSKEMRQSITLKLLKLVTDLVREGELALAKIMRMKVMEKCDPNQKPVENLRIVTSGPKSPNRGLLDFKSYEVAEQLTIIENAFYQRLELPELLIWSKEQNEEKCPNLVKFTEHFNKMSYWCRNSILKPDDPTLREKHFIKFVHILKHLRKHNNFNSLLALLSALDSAPVSRLDWPKQERDMIQEYSSLIDCTSSFKSYRMALAEAQPPCIPYIGLILNDMTIIRVGNKPSLFDGGINFQMRWQLFNVLECLRRFRKPAYPFKKDPKILEFIDNFSDSNSNDDEMWERSQEIKPTSVK